MYIDAVTSDDVDDLYSSNHIGSQGQTWNGREVEELTETNLQPNFAAYLKEIKPMMSGGNISGGLSYSEREGLKVELKVEAQLGPSKDKESRESENRESETTQSDPPDSQDRESSNK